MYFNEEENNDHDECLRIPVQIVNKLYKTVFSEYNASIFGAHKAFLSPILYRLDEIRKQAVQQALIGGECFVKPILYGKSFDFVVVRRDNFVPFARDVHGRITDVGTTETTVVGKWRYTLCERRTVKEDGTLVIDSRLYRSDDPMHLGVRISLSALPQYAAVDPVIELPGVYNLGMVQVKTPQENTVDGSCDGVSVYAPAVGLINNINRNEQLLKQEFENGGSKIIASADMLTTDAKGKKRFGDSVFVAIDDDPETVGVTVYNPTLREASFLARKQEYLRNCESIIGLKRGILSEVEATERTARAITSSEGDYNLTILDFQEMWENAAKEVMFTCLKLGAAYNFIQSADVDIEKEFSIDWGDGVLYNRDKVWSELVGMVNSGMLKPEIAVAWYFDMPYEDEKDLQKVRDKYMPLIEQLEGE
ncbi:MAG: hypothetical protein IKM48_03195 [Clostridia bacterium]|nr:hypothetical protein [Clostridia bacterium]